MGTFYDIFPEEKWVSQWHEWTFFWVAILTHFRIDKTLRNNKYFLFQGHFKSADSSEFCFKTRTSVCFSLRNGFSSGMHKKYRKHQISKRTLELSPKQTFAKEAPLKSRVEEKIARERKNSSKRKKPLAYKLSWQREGGNKTAHTGYNFSSLTFFSDPTRLFFPIL